MRNFFIFIWILFHPLICINSYL